MTDQLFCYGTLCIPEVMCQVIGRVPKSLTGSLLGYACYSLTGLTYPAIVPEKEAWAQGVLYQGLSRAQLAKLDAYEGEQYRRQRVRVDVERGRTEQAWTYTLHPRYYHRLGGKGWSLEQFRHEQLAQYLRL